MSAGFAELIEFCRREILALKTGIFKSSIQVETITKTGSMQFTMTANSTTLYVHPVKVAVVAVTPTNGKFALSQMTLDISDVEDRTLSAIGYGPPSGYDEDGTTYYEVSPSGNSSDLSRILNGETVTLNYNFTVTCTSDFSLTVNYEDY